MSDLEREQRRADAEVELVKSRRQRDEERLNSGVITNPKDLSGLQHELAAIERRIATLEDEELEVMEALEEAQSVQSAVSAELAVKLSERERIVADRDLKISQIDAEAADAVQEREQLAAAIPADLIALYDKVRANQGGLAAAALRARRCEGCRLELNGADLRELAAAPDDEVLRCPECSRILVRTAESGLA